MSVSAEFIEKVRSNPVFCANCQKQTALWSHKDASGTDGLNVYKCTECGSAQAGFDYIVSAA